MEPTDLGASVHLATIRTALTKRIEDPIEHAKALPALIRSVDGAIVGELLREMVPTTAAVQAVHDRIERATLVNPLAAETAGRIVLFEDWTDPLPLLIGDPVDGSLRVSIVDLMIHGFPPDPSALARSVPLGLTLSAAATAREVRRSVAFRAE
jgi:hypothetical protein